MGLFGKLFGDRKETGAVVPPPIPAVPAKVEGMVQIYDQYGRKVEIPRQVWRDQVLPDHLKTIWDQPGPLGGVILQAMHDELFEEMVGPAERLIQIDPDVERASVLLGIIYMKLNRLSEAESVFVEFMRKHGETGSVLTNLAKVYDERDEKKKSLETLWRGLQIDPNQDNGLMWFEAIHREKSGRDGGLEALRLVATLPRSWRARLWLARNALENRQLEAALQYYREAMEMAGSHVSGGMLMQISGDLGKNGHLPELLALIEPVYQPEMHGMETGNNLIQANLDLGRTEVARDILNRLFAMDRPQWQETLNFWDHKIAEFETEVRAIDVQAPRGITLLLLDGPIWLGARSLLNGLSPVKASDCVRVGFWGSSVSDGANVQKPRLEMSNISGRFSRIFPLFLAEQLHLQTRAEAKVMQPCFEEQGSFVVSDRPMDPERVCGHARTGDPTLDYVGITHLDISSEPWKVELRLFRTIDCALIFEHRIELFNEALREKSLELWEHLRSRLGEMQIAEMPIPNWYRIPEEKAFSSYLARLEQALAVTMGAIQPDSPNHLSGERQILESNLNLCLSERDNPTLRMLLVETLFEMKKIRPQIVEEFRARMLLLQEEHPLAGPAAEPISAAVRELFPE